MTRNHQQPLPETRREIGSIFDHGSRGGVRRARLVSGETPRSIRVCVCEIIVFQNDRTRFDRVGRKILPTEVSRFRKSSAFMYRRLTNRIHVARGSRERAVPRLTLSLQRFELSHIELSFSGNIVFSIFCFRRQSFSDKHRSNYDFSHF